MPRLEKVEDAGQRWVGRMRRRWIVAGPCRSGRSRARIPRRPSSAVPLGASGGGAGPRRFSLGAPGPPARPAHRPPPHLHSTRRSSLAPPAPAPAGLHLPQHHPSALSLAALAETKPSTSLPFLLEDMEAVHIGGCADNATTARRLRARANASSASKTPSVAASAEATPNHLYNRAPVTVMRTNEWERVVIVSGE